MTTVPQVYRNRLSWGNRIRRLLWNVVYSILFRPSPVPFHWWRRFILRRFGAKIGDGAHPYPTCKIWAPWNLTMGAHSCLAADVDCYSVAAIEIGSHVTVSQYSHLCAATHDYEDPEFVLVARPIRIEAQAWICAGAFVGPGVTVGAGAVVGARTVVTRNVEAWTIVGSAGLRLLGRRTIRGNM